MGQIIDIKTEGFGYIVANLGNACNDIDEAVAQIVSVESGLNMRVQAKENIISGLNALRSNVHMQRDRVNLLKDQTNSALQEYTEIDNSLGAKARGINNSWNIQNSNIGAALIKGVWAINNSVLKSIQGIWGIGAWTWSIGDNIRDIITSIGTTEKENPWGKVPIHFEDDYDYSKEQDLVRDYMHHNKGDHKGVSWNYGGPPKSVDCNWYCKLKLIMRGFGGNRNVLNDGEVKGFVINSDEAYEQWKSNSGGNGGFAGTTAAYLKQKIAENGGKPLSNIYVRYDGPGDNHDHSLLIDKVYIENGKLKFVFSENNAGGKPIELEESRSWGNKAYDISDQRTYSEEEFLGKYQDKGAPTILKIFGDNP